MDQKARGILGRIFFNHRRNFNIRLWNLYFIKWTSSPAFTIVFKNKAEFKKIFFRFDPFVAAAAYAEGKLDIEGDIFEAVKLWDHFSSIKLNWKDKFMVLTELWSL